MYKFNAAIMHVTQSKKFDLDERTAKFARECRELLQNIPKTVLNEDDIRQLVRSSGSVAANYIEANQSISKKDFLHRIKLCRKEAKESWLWLQLLNINSSTCLTKRDILVYEALQLTKIFGAIIRNSEAK